MQNENPAPEPSFRSILMQPEILATVALQFLVMIGMGMVLPMLPLYARSFGVSLAAAGLMVSMFGLVRLFSDLVAGPIVDRFGERAVAPIGLLIYAAGNLASGFAPNFPIAVLTLALGGAGSAVFFAAQFSYVMKAAEEGTMARALSVFYASFNAGIIAGGILTGFVVQAFGIAAPLRIYGLLLVVIAIAYRPVTPAVAAPAPDPALSTGEVLVEAEAAGPRRRFGPLRAVISSRGFWTVMAVQFAYMWMVATIFDTLLPLFGKEELGMTEAGVGIIFGIAVAAEFLVLFPAGKQADRIGRKPVMVPALIALAVSCAVLGLAPSAFILGVLVFLLGLASGYAGVPPAAMLSDVIPEKYSGSGVGAFRFVGDFAIFVGPIASGALAGATGFTNAFILCTLPILGAFLVVLRTPDTAAIKKERLAAEKKDPIPA